MNDAEGLQKSRAGYFKLGRTGGGLGRRRGGQRKDQGNAAGPRVSSASTCRAAWVPPLREVGGGPLADSPRPLGRGPAGSRRCGRCGSPHSVRGLFTSPTGSRVGRGRGGGADRGPPAFKFRQEGLGPALRGAREFGAGVATLAFPDTGRLGSVPWAARGPGAGLGRRVTPAGLGPGPGGRARASGQRRRRAAGTPSSWSGGGQRAGDVSRGSGGISRGLGLKVSGD